MEQVRKQHTTPAPAEEVVDDLPIVEPADLVETDEVLDTIEDVLGDHDELADVVLLDAVRAEKVQTVKRREGRSFLAASGSARAWTMGGQVD